MTSEWYGCRRDRLDLRDQKFVPPPAADVTCVDLRASCPPVPEAQGPVGSCVAYGVATALRHLLRRSGTSDTPLSRLQMYYDARAAEGHAKEDVGAEIRTGIKCVRKLGAAPEELWPYRLDRVTTRPPAHVYDAAIKFDGLVYERVRVDATTMKQALADGHPIVVGVALFESFEGLAVERSGVVPMPDLRREQLTANHCMLVVGCGQREGHFTTRNWWGADWGDGGDCYFPEPYLGSTRYGSDYWIIRSKTGEVSS